MEKATQVKRAIDKEAARAAKRLGATHVAMIGFFPDGSHFQVHDGGSAPMSFLKLYKQLVYINEMLEKSGEDHVTLLSDVSQAH